MPSGNTNKELRQRLTQSQRVMENATALYKGAGLPFPPIPSQLVDQFVEVENWVYGTRSDHPFIYDIDWFIEEAVKQQSANYVLLGHSGHGVNSWAIHYYLVQGQLALFIQVGWGGAYGTPQDSANACALLERLQTEGHHLSELVAAGKVAPDERLIVVASTFYGGQWLRVDRTVNLDHQPWQQCQPETVIEAASR